MTAAVAPLSLPSGAGVACESARGREGSGVAATATGRGVGARAAVATSSCAAALARPPPSSAGYAAKTPRSGPTAWALEAAMKQQDIVTNGGGDGARAWCRRRLLLWKSSPWPEFGGVARRRRGGDGAGSIAVAHLVSLASCTIDRQQRRSGCVAACIDRQQGDREQRRLAAGSSSWTAKQGTRAAEQCTAAQPN
uniref:Uncharacterized protein n=1 Tax=Oryza sativa subsp. japonica TaxID=39947 RepID=Q8LIL3_ORYSJ|nr:hypothetical protein [Oryza sativa Japonica Group]